ncbi:MAG TPA: M36 family metallopeptidase [Pseudomonadota bacterium]|nr:M36 family metallopeptidase [Pseudomonadota bacterium]
MRKSRFGSRIFPRVGLGALAGLFGACGQPNAPEANVAQPSADNGPALRLVSQVMHRDRESGQPTLSRIRAENSIPMGSDKKTVAWSALRGLKSAYSLTSESVSQAKLSDLHDAGNGPLIAHFDQEIDGVPVFRRSLKIAMDRDMNPQFAAGHFAAKTRRVSDKWAMDETVAVSAAFRSMTNGRYVLSKLHFSGKQAGAYSKLEMESAPDIEGLVQGGPARVRKVWFARPEGLVPSYYTELEVGYRSSNDSRMMAFVVSAVDGTVFFKHSLTAADAFTYRVWADTTAPYRPWDSPMGNSFTPHPTGTRTTAAPTFQASNLVTLESAGFSRNDPWLPADATELNGNNVFAYADLASPDGFATGDVRVPPTAAKTFDRNYDPTTDPLASTSNSQAITTNLFFILNWLHDDFYDAGWTESAWNAQKSNMGRGGTEGDPIRGEAQDYSGRNNANASTPADGGMPRIQMYVWDANASGLKVNAPADISGNYETSGAPYGSPNFTTTGEVVIADDGSGTKEDGCEAPFVNAAAMAGKIAMLTYGDNCNSRTKVKNAQISGAKGVILVSVDTALGLPYMAGTDPTITVGVVGMTYDDGMKLWNKITGGTSVNVTITGNRAVRDGSLDTGVVAHEWGHILTNRLVGNAAGLSNNQGRSMGEGWGDFLVLLTVARAEDATAPANANWNGVFPDLGYSIWAPGNYAFYDGLRRYPYSTDMTKNPLTFKHIEDGITLPNSPAPAFGGDGAMNAEVHNAGEIWGIAMWECYAALLRDARFTFQQANERMRRYLVASLKLTPNAPTFLEARDAVLAAAWASDRADYDLFVQAFAKRGMGSGSVAPDRASTDHSGLVESFATGADLAIDNITLDQSTTDCDKDGVLDNDEAGNLIITVRNSGNKDLASGTIKVTATIPEVTVPGPVNIPTLAPFQSTTIKVPVSLAGAKTVVAFDFTIEADGTGLYKPGPITTTYSVQGNYDVVAGQSTTDKFSVRNSGWVVEDDEALFAEPWNFVPGSGGDGFWNGPDSDPPSDHRFVSPPIKAGTEGMTLKIKHRYSFERDTSNFYDGGVLELSDDGGVLWIDIASVPGVTVTNGYNATLVAPSTNPLGGRKAFGGDSTGYATKDWITTTVEIGKILASKELRFRFRAGSDDLFGGPGWDIDEVSVSGVVGKPFSSTVTHRGLCVKEESKFQIATTDLLNIPSGFQVVMTATATSPSGAVKWAWTQTGGPNVTLSGADTATPNFMAPSVDAPTMFTFKVTGTDSKSTVREATANVQVVKAGNSGGGSSSGCSFVGGGHAAAGSLPTVGAFALMLAGLGRRRRRG